MSELTKDLTADEILKARSGGQPEQVPVPEWGGNVYVGKVSLDEQLELEQTYNQDGNRPFMLKLIALALVDKAGKRLFDSPEAIAPLADKEAAVVVRIFRAAGKYNAIDTGAAEDIEKN